MGSFGPFLSWDFCSPVFTCFHDWAMDGSEWVVEVEPSREASADRPAWSAAYRCKDFPACDPSSSDFPTVYDLWRKSVSRNKDLACLGVRKAAPSKRAADSYAFLSYQHVHLHVASAAGTMMGRHGMVPAASDSARVHVGILGGNCPAWTISFLACARSNMVCVPLYETLGENAVSYVIGHAELQVVFVSTDKILRLAGAVEDLKGKHSLKEVVYWGDSLPAWNEAIVKLGDAGVRTHVFEDYMDMGETNRFAANPPDPGDLCTIMYTSGSTGVPKGVMLTHRAFVQNVASLDTFFKKNGYDIGVGDSFLSYLPLAHIFDLTFEVWLMKKGARIGFYSGNPKEILLDAQRLRPTLFIGVPRVYDRLCDFARSRISASNVIRRLAFAWGYRRKLAFLRSGVPAAKASPIFNMFCRNIHNLIGGRQRLMISGGAPLSSSNEEFLRTTMRCPVFQAYGLTETTAAALSSVPDVYEHFGSVGPPLPATCVRLESVPEFGYDAMGSPPSGEVLVKSSHNLVGYYKEDAITKKAITSDGWLHTGDIGQFKDGALTLIDRRNNIFKMSHGEFVPVEVVENKLKQCAIVDQIWVYGEMTKPELVAVVVPNTSLLEAWAQNSGLHGCAADLCKTPEACDYVVECLRSEATAKKMSKLQFIKSVHLDPVPFSPERDLLTPTFKPRRRQLLAYYKADIDRLYSQIAE